MIKDLIMTFCKYEIKIFVIRTEREQVKTEQVLRPYFRHFLYQDTSNNRYIIEEHRNPSMSYVLKKNEQTIKMNMFEHFLLKRYIRKNYFG